MLSVSILFRMNKNKLYQELFSSYKKAHPYKSGKACQDIVVKFWNDSKNETNFYEIIVEKIQQCEEKLSRNKKLFFAAGRLSRTVTHEDKKNSSDAVNSIDHLKMESKVEIDPAEEQPNREIDLNNMDSDSLRLVNGFPLQHFLLDRDAPEFESGHGNIPIEELLQPVRIFYHPNTVTFF